MKDHNTNHHRAADPTRSRAALSAPASIEHPDTVKKAWQTTPDRAAKPEWRVFAFVANSIGNDLAGTAWNDRPYARQIAEHVFEAIENAGYEVRKRDE